MASFEYKVLVLPASNYDVDEEILSLHGEKGWELVNVLLDGSNHRVAYFKRGRKQAAGADLEATMNQPSAAASE